VKPGPVCQYGVPVLPRADGNAECVSGAERVFSGSCEGDAAEGDQGDGAGRLRDGGHDPCRDLFWGRVLLPPSLWEADVVVT